VVTTASQQSGYPMAPRDSLPRAPSPPSALLPHGLFAARRMLPFDLDNTATSLARTICPGVGTCVERPLALPRDTETRQQAQQVAERPGFPEICRPHRLGPRRYTLTTLRQQLAEEGRGCFYTAELDPGPYEGVLQHRRGCGYHRRHGGRRRRCSSSRSRGRS